MTREKAIKIVKEFINGTCLHMVDQEAFETLIPELKESEDERIREEIISALKFANDGGVYDKHIAYLEKQKEQNSKDEECTDFTIYYPLKNGKGDYECIPYSFYGSLTSFSEDKDLIDFLHTCFYTEEECEEWIEKQKEQKDYRKLYEDIAKSEWFKKAYVGKSLGEEEEKEEPKPTEWSKEDEKIRQSIIKDIEFERNYTSAETGTVIGKYSEQINWLKSLNPQPKAELTLLDENIINATVAFVEQNDHFNCWGGIDKHTVIKALHSLKPHWKPSKEQIGALNYAYCKLFKRKDVGHNILGPLQKLCDELKKLM